MAEAGVDISKHTSDNVNKYLNQEWDYVITVCGDAKETCPIFTGKSKTPLAHRFEDLKRSHRLQRIYHERISTYSR